MSLVSLAILGAAAPALLGDLRRQIEREGAEALARRAVRALALSTTHAERQELALFAGALAKVLTTDWPHEPGTHAAH